MDKYSIVRVLGEGAFGKVLLATNKEDKNAKVAVKEIKNQFKNWDECVKLRELKALKMLRHVRIVRLKEMVLENQCLYFVFEFIDSNLADVLDNRKHKKLGPMPLVEIQRCMYSLLEGICFMHKMGLFHRDIKPDNLLCDCDGRNLKIADFGLARELRSRPPYTEYVSTRWYRAPEVILCDQAYSSPVDLWACGCILAELFSLSPLFPGTSSGDQMSRIVNLVGEPSSSNWPEGVRLASACHMRIPRTNPCSFKDVLKLGNLSSTDKASALQLTECMLELDPSKRPSASQSLQSNFFARFDPNTDESVSQSACQSDSQSRRRDSKETDLSAAPMLRGSSGGGIRSVSHEAPSSPSVGIEDDIDDLLGDLGFPVSPAPVKATPLPHIKQSASSSETPSLGTLKQQSSLDEILCSLDAEFHSPTEGNDVGVDFDVSSPEVSHIPSIVTPSSAPTPIFTSSPSPTVPSATTNTTTATSESSQFVPSPEANSASKSTSSKKSKSTTSEPFSEQELAVLVSAVELFPISAGLDRNVRWKKIAHHVGNGRSKKECFEAFRDHCVSVKEKKKKKEQRRASNESMSSMGAAPAESAEETQQPKLREARGSVRRSEQFAPPNHKAPNPEAPLVVESLVDEFP